jgi:hypothetical protein
MTMRLDIVTNDSGELVRREHARDLGAGVVVAIYRLAKLAQVHDLQNQAFLRQLEQTHQIIGDYCLRAGANVNVLFAHKAIFVAGQLLKGSRGTYEMASELGEIFERLGGSELSISRDITRDELFGVAEQISAGFRTGRGGFRSTPKVRLRPVNEAARLRGLELETLTDEQRIVRMYANAVVIMRRFFEDLHGSKYILPRRIKRIAQSLVDLSEGSTVSFLGVTDVRNANFDEAGRAINSAVIAVAMARETTDDRGTLSQIAMAAMMFDVARPRALALMAASGPSMPGMASAVSLSEDQEDRLAAGAAAVLTALGRVNEPSITRTVLTFESLWLRRQTWLGPLYQGSREATLHARIIHVARRYNDLLTPEPGLMPPTPDHGVATLAQELTDPQDRAVLRLLVSALGLVPLGTTVQLNTGEWAEVTRGAHGVGRRPGVRVVCDARGAPLAQPYDLDLATDTQHSVMRVLSVDGWKKGLAESEVEGGYDADDSDPPPAPDAQPQQLSPLSPNPIGAPPRSVSEQYSEQYAAWGDANEPAPPSGSGISGSSEHNSGVSSASLPSLGSSPSAVAEAMGRMINDSLRPPPPRSSGTNEEAGRTQRPASAGQPTATGSLAATPLPHVLVYMLDHTLTGSVVFHLEDGSEDTIFFVRGVPMKVRLSEPVALLGETLVHAGYLDEAQIPQLVADAQSLELLFGEYLAGHDIITREGLAWALEAQLLAKVASLANLAPEISYSYFRDVDLLDGWGSAEPVASSPLNPILASVRSWMDRARVRATLNRIGKHPLVLHEDADLTALALLPHEQEVVAAIQAESLSLPQLFKRQLADEEAVSSVIYVLAVTRQFAFKGQKRGAMAPRNSQQWRAAALAPSSSGRVPAASGAIPTSNAPSSPQRPAVAVSAGGRVNKPHGQIPRAAPPPARPPPAAPSPARPGSAPQIRPVAGRTPPRIRPAAAPPTGARPPVQTAKKATIHGLQPSQPAPSRRLATPASLRHNDDVSDTAKTVARAAPVIPGRRPLPGTRRPAPAARPPAASPPAPRAAPPAPHAAPPAPHSSRSRMPAQPQPPPPAESSEISIDVDLSGGELSDDMAEAEAALQAMTSFRMAEAALQRGDLQGAETLAAKAYKADPTQSDYSTLLAWVRVQLGKVRADAAVLTMTTVLEDDPSNERALLYRGKLYAQLGRAPEATADFNELLSTNPHHREAAAALRSLGG